MKPIKLMNEPSNLDKQFVMVKGKQPSIKHSLGSSAKH